MALLRRIQRARSEQRRRIPGAVRCARRRARVGGTIGASDIQRNAVRSRHIKAKNVRRTDLAVGAVNSRKVANGSLRGADIDEKTLSRIGAGVLGGQWRNLSPGSGTVCEPPAGTSLGPDAHSLAVAGSGGPHPIQGEPFVAPGGGGTRASSASSGDDPGGDSIGLLTCRWPGNRQDLRQRRPDGEGSGGRFLPRRGGYERQPRRGLCDLWLPGAHPVARDPR